MGKNWVEKLVQAAYITITIAAVCQELEKTEEERGWHGKLGLVPYDFRMPSLERFKNSFWNPDDSRIFTPEPFGIGWAVNFHTILEKMQIITEAYMSEDDFLMPTPTLRRILENRPAVE
ncbi:MAG: DUF5808 domain-containing protein [Dehalococcoidales bacterium]|nr:DUF5808 domain-containing protein [Dehalococcoidales bacterium]